MSKKFLTFFVLNFFLFLIFTRSVHAIENPLEKPNNKFGIHIFFTTEVASAAKLINSNGGDWGYVTIPIQSSDRDLKKWQSFMQNCKKYHVIPILRLATEGDYQTPHAWRKPRLTDVIDSATFLSKLNWPTKNRYVIIYNEVNRADEWGGSANAAEYANVLSFAVTVFKSKSPDFFIISAGLDNAAPNQGTKFVNHYEFMRQMNEAIPAIFNQIDGLGSHSYPNPAFAQAPNINSTTGVASFKYERELAKTLTGKALPVFITETGWSANKVTEEQKIKYYQDTVETIWNDEGIVAITPFVLEAVGGDFQQFSFLTSTGSATKQYQLVKQILKVKGTPVFPSKVLAAETTNETTEFSPSIQHEKTGFSFQNMIKSIFRLFKS